LDREDRKSWCVENHDADDRGPVIDPVDFLSSAECDARAYCSFLIQNDRDSFDRVVARFPVPEFGWDDELVHERAVWIFFGRNPVGNPELDGRPDHTDSVSHDGTWHYQLSGKKEWNLRPSSGLLRHFDRILPRRATSEGWTPEELRLTVMCSERDVLMVNTRLWFHRTRIPAQRVPSVSFARDFRFPSDDDDADADDAEGQVADDGGQEAEPGGMSNLDGLYARADIDEGTVIFTETDMPDAELHVSSSDPNCQVVTLEDGGSAVVSRRLIRAGEFFCVPESPSDEDDDSDDDDEYDNDCGHGEDDDDKADDEDGGADED
jgi:U3 small nucleolar RNA-associated protein 6